MSTQIFAYAAVALFLLVANSILIVLSTTGVMVGDRDVIAWGLLVNLATAAPIYVTRILLRRKFQTSTTT